MLHTTCIHIFTTDDGETITVEYVGKPTEAKFLFFTYQRQKKKFRTFQTSEMATRFVKDLLDGTMSDP